jgi:hypothetical protein
VTYCRGTPSIRAISARLPYSASTQALKSVISFSVSSCDIRSFSEVYSNPNTKSKQSSLANVLVYQYSAAIMKAASKSITFTPSKTVARQLEELSRITQTAIDTIVKNTVTAELARAADALHSWFDLEMMIPRLHTAEDRAKTIAGNYNAHAEQMGWSAKRRAYVLPAEDGRFRIRFTMSQKERRALAA